MLYNLTPDVPGFAGNVFRFSDILGNRGGGRFTTVLGPVGSDRAPGAGGFSPDPDQLHRFFHYDFQYSNRQLLNHTGKPRLYFSLSHAGSYIRPDPSMAAFAKETFNEKVVMLWGSRSTLAGGRGMGRTCPSMSMAA